MEGNVSFEDENISISAAARLAFPLQWAIQGSGETAERLTAHAQSEWPSGGGEGSTRTARQKKKNIPKNKTSRSQQQACTTVTTKTQWTELFKDSRMWGWTTVNLYSERQLQPTSCFGWTKLIVIQNNMKMNSNMCGHTCKPCSLWRVRQMTLLKRKLWQKDTWPWSEGTYLSCLLRLYGAEKGRDMWLVAVRHLETQVSCAANLALQKCLSEIWLCVWRWWFKKRNVIWISTYMKWLMIQ